MGPFLPLLPAPAGQEASSLPCQPNFRGERPPDWWDLVHPGQAAEAQLVDTGLAQQHRSGGSRDWELVDGSESAVAKPIPAALLAGTRGKVTGHPLSPDDPPHLARPRSTATHRAPLTERHRGSAGAAASGVCGGTCLSPPRWLEGGRDRGLALRQLSGASTNSPVVLEPSASRPSLPGCSLREQPKVG